VVVVCNVNFFKKMFTIILVVPDLCSWAEVMQTTHRRVQHSPCCRDRNWVPCLFPCLQQIFSASEARGGNSLVLAGPGNMLCDGAWYSPTVIGSGECLCPPTFGGSVLPQLPSVTDDLRKGILKVYHAISQACDTKRVPDKLSILRLNDW